MPEFKHTSVLLPETVDSLNVVSGGTYIDCTAGGGGHSAAILEKLGPAGRLVCIDRDEDAVEVLEKRFSGDDRVTVVHGVFFFIRDIAGKLGIVNADGITADLGISSFMVDNPEKGFSYRQNGPLSMAMGLNSLTAYDVVNTYPFERLRDVISRYGEEKYAAPIARAIVRKREQAPLATTLDLSGVISSAVPAKARRDGHPARRTFQAIRIEVNNEINGLENSLDDMFALLKPGGRLAIITFHSLEDKVVKRKFADFCRPRQLPPGENAYSLTAPAAAKYVVRGAEPSDGETASNPRARSAKLRTIAKTQT